MSRREKRHIKRGRLPEAPCAESRPAEAATVAWMLATMATLAAEAIALLTLAIITLGGEPDQAPLLARMTPGVMLAIAVLTGLVGLALNVVASRMRSVSPPRAVAVGATLINLSPLLIIGILGLAQWLRAS